jgi:hypothetical protein
MVVVRLETSANWRLQPTGPCEICGEATCKRFTPGGA